MSAYTVHWPKTGCFDNGNSFDRIPFTISQVSKFHFYGFDTMICLSLIMIHNLWFTERLVSLVTSCPEKRVILESPSKIISLVRFLARVPDSWCIHWLKHFIRDSITTHKVFLKTWTREFFFPACWIVQGIESRPLTRIVSWFIRFDKRNSSP